MAVRIHPYGDKVLVRMVKAALVRGMIMPDISQEGKQYVIEAVGPDVKRLKPGDKVLVSGVQDVHWSFLPGYSDLFIIGEKDVPLTYEDVPEEGEAD